METEDKCIMTAWNGELYSQFQLELVLLKILSVIFCLISELRDDGARRHLCPYHIGTSHSIVIISVAKIICMLKSYQGARQGIVVDYVGANIYTVLLKWVKGELEKPTAFPIYFPSTSYCCVG
jgi:hypothetical protein